MTRDHNRTTTFEAVRASTDPGWLWDVAGECDVDPAEPELCPNCLAYRRAAELESDDTTQEGGYTIGAVGGAMDDLAQEAGELFSRLGAYGDDVPIGVGSTLTVGDVRRAVRERFVPPTQAGEGAQAPSDDRPLFGPAELPGTHPGSQWRIAPTPYDSPGELSWERQDAQGGWYRHRRTTPEELHLAVLLRASEARGGETRAELFAANEACDAFDEQAREAEARAVKREDALLELYLASTEDADAKAEANTLTPNTPYEECEASKLRVYAAERRLEDADLVAVGLLAHRLEPTL